MKAHIQIKNGQFSDWEDFFQSYRDKRSQFVENEVIVQINEHEAEVSFDVLDIEGLTELSASEDIREKEEKLGIVTTLR
ncbi:MAG: hypothetical protein ACO2Z9_10520 [Crocinitomicaceae bacterium]